MARDYAKKPSHSRTPAGGGAPAWVWLSAGLSIGLFIAFLIYLQGAGTRSTPAATAPTTAATERNQEARGVRRDERTAPATPDSPSEPRFDFYRILPEMEATRVDPPAARARPPGERDAAAVPTPSAVPDPATTPRLEPGSYILQVGAFRQLDEADSLKASLALLGVEATIQTVRAAGDQTWHRVRVGPMKDLKRLETIRARLKDNDIETMLLKLST